MVLPPQHARQARRGLIGGGNAAAPVFSTDVGDAARRHHPELVEASSPAASQLDAIVAEYRRIYPDYSASDVFFAVTTAARSWKGMVQESERRARGNTGRPMGLQHQLAFAARRRQVARAAHDRYPAGLRQSVATKPLHEGRARRADGGRRDERALLAFARTGNPGTTALRLGRASNWNNVPRCSSTRPRQRWKTTRAGRTERKFFEAAPYVQGSRAPEPGGRRQMRGGR